MQVFAWQHSDSSKQMFVICINITAFCPIHFQNKICIQSSTIAKKWMEVHIDSIDNLVIHM